MKIDESNLAYKIFKELGFEWGGSWSTVKDYQHFEKKLLGITAMTSLLGKKKFEELLGGLVTKPPGKPALVPESDKRPALNTAKDDFDEI